MFDRIAFLKELKSRLLAQGELGQSGSLYNPHSKTRCAIGLMAPRHSFTHEACCEVLGCAQSDVRGTNTQVRCDFIWLKKSIIREHDIYARDPDRIRGFKHYIEHLETLLAIQEVVKADHKFVTFPAPRPVEPVEVVEATVLPEPELVGA
jgi:hypothetical protein